MSALGQDIWAAWMLSKASWKGHKTRMLAQILIVATAVAIIGTGVLVNQGVESSWQATMSNLEAPHLWVYPPASEAKALYAAMNANPNIAALTSLYPMQYGWIRTAAKRIRVRFQPLPSPTETPRFLILNQGAWPTQQEQAVVLERGVALYGEVGVGEHLDIIGPNGRVADAVVQGIVLDASTAAYPVAQPARVYLPRAMWSTIVGTTEPKKTGYFFGIRLKDPSEIQTVSREIQELVSNKNKLWTYSWRMIVDGLSPFTMAISAFLLLFGAFAAVAYTLFTWGIVQVDAIRQMKTIGIMRTIGATWRVIVGKYLLDNMIAVFVGWMIGYVGIRALSREIGARLVTVMGLQVSIPAVDEIVVSLSILAGLMLLVLITVISSIRGLRRIAPALALTGGYQRFLYSTTKKRRGLVKLPWVSFWTRMAFSAFSSRPLYAIISISVLGLGLVTVVFAIILNHTIKLFQTDPAVWGIHYDIVLYPGKEIDQQDVQDNLARINAVTGYDRMEQTSVFLIDYGTTVPVKLLAPSQHAVVISMIEGHMIKNPEEDVLLGAGLAKELGITPGEILSVQVGDGEPKSIRVAGVYRELDNMGRYILGNEALLTTLQIPQEAVYSRYLIRINDAASAEQVARLIEEQFEQRVIARPVQETLDVPFGNLIQWLLWSLGGGLMLMATIIMFIMMMVFSSSQVYAFGVMKAVGAGRQSLRRIARRLGYVLFGPAISGGILVSVFVAVQSISLLSQQFGGVPVQIPWKQLVLGSTLAVFPPVIGFILPLGKAMRSLPAATLARSEK